MSLRIFFNFEENVDEMLLHMDRYKQDLEVQNIYVENESFRNAIVLMLHIESDFFLLLIILDALQKNILAFCNWHVFR